MIVEVLYNPNAGRDASAMLGKLPALFVGAQIRHTNVTEMTDYSKLYALGAQDCVVVAGGDGTLNRFVNDVDVKMLKCRLKYYPIGSGNDFAHDLGYEKGSDPFDVKALLEDLPVFCANGVERKFINGIGVGLDGYVCRKGNEQHARTGKAVNYTMVAVIALLFGFKPVNAAVTVDGVRREYHRAWLAPTMKGRYFGGGMMIAPDQHRTDAGISSVIYHNAGALFTMYVFPSIFKGGHVRFTKQVEIRKGHEVKVELDRPCDLQADGEIMTNVSEYTVRYV